MFLFRKKYIAWIILLVIAVNAAVVSNYFSGLKYKFPDMDMTRARVGIASWYSKHDKYINERTANNEKFNHDSMTCASWHYPFHEELLVVNALNGKWVVCRVNDRGPAKRLKREIDLTKAAFRKISHSKKGLIPVTVIPIHKRKPKP